MIRDREERGRTREVRERVRDGPRMYEPEWPSFKLFNFKIPPPKFLNFQSNPNSYFYFILALEMLHFDPHNFKIFSKTHLKMTILPFKKMEDFTYTMYNIST